MTQILKSAFRSRNDVDAGIEPHGSIALRLTVPVQTTTLSFCRHRPLASLLLRVPINRINGRAMSAFRPRADVREPTS